MPQELRKEVEDDMHVWVMGPTQRRKRLTALTKQLPFYLLSIWGFHVGVCSSYSTVM